MLVDICGEDKAVKITIGIQTEKPLLFLLIASDVAEVSQHYLLNFSQVQLTDMTVVVHSVP